MHIDRKQLILAWLLAMLIIVELLILLSLIYFSRLPFFIFVFVVGLKLVSFFLVGAIGVFFAFFIFSRKPKETLESWVSSLREYAQYIRVSFFITVILIVICVFLGAGIELVLRKVYHISPLDTVIESFRLWLAMHLR